MWICNSYHKIYLLFIYLKKNLCGGRAARTYLYTNLQFFLSLYTCDFENLCLWDNGIPNLEYIRQTGRSRYLAIQILSKRHN